MTVATELSARTLTGDGSTTSFPCGFRALDDAHLSVYLAGVLRTLGTHYTVSGAGDPDSTVTVEMLTAPGNGVALYVERNTPILQSVDLRPEGRFDSDDVEEMFDKLTLIAQENRRIAEEAAAIASPAVISAGSIVFTDHTFTADADDVESTFPFNVTVASGSTATGCWCVRLRNLTNPSAVFDEKPAIQWAPGVGNAVSLQGVDGLQPGDEYTIRLATVIP